MPAQRYTELNPTQLAACIRSMPAFARSYADALAASVNAERCAARARLGAWPEEAAAPALGSERLLRSER